MEGSKILLGGTAATFKDMRDGSNYDLLIAGIASMCLIFIIMLILTRSVVASAVIVGTVLVSLGASFGLSVLIWQHLIGIELHWMVLAMSVIILLAVGADYNLLLVSRFKEEIHAGLNTGIIRAGVRLHDDDHGGQSVDGHRPGRHHHWSGPAVRHPDRALTDDAGHRGPAGQVVLVAAASPATPGALTLAGSKCRVGQGTSIRDPR
jgi:RND superfamily putative drug exporter